jgi:hypothetical protein
MGYTGRIPSWLIRECYPVYAAHRELEELDIDIVLEALHQKLGSRGKGKWKMRAEFGGVDRRSIGYEIPEEGLSDHENAPSGFTGKGTWR